MWFSEELGGPREDVTERFEPSRDSFSARGGCEEQADLFDPCDTVEPAE